MKKVDKSKKEFDVIIVGAGPAGLGVSIVLERLGIDYLVLDREGIGGSFKKWPKETRFISPSFTGNFFKMPDLNAISPDSSPAFTLLTEHPTGAEYVEYLEAVSSHYGLKVRENIDVEKIAKKEGTFAISTSDGLYTSKYLIWAAGEYQYPRTQSFKGSELCLHYSAVDSFSSLKGDERIVIGSYESGFDAAVNLAKLGKKVTLFDKEDYMGLINSDSSYSLSPHTRDRIKETIDKIDYHKKSKVTEVVLEGDNYIVKTTSKTFTSKYKPITCTGFDSSLTLVYDSFAFEEGYPLLNDFDESITTENLFLVGPQVKHANALFCFIYKYRQRFAIVGEELAKRLRIPIEIIEEVLEEYKENNFYLKDLSCCDGECTC